MPTLQQYNYALNNTAFKTGAQTLRGSHNIIPGDPVHIGHDRQLLMDWHVVDDLNGCDRKVKQPVKHPDNPLINDQGLGDPGPTSWGSVFRDPYTRLFRLWTVTHDPKQVQKLGKIGPGAWYGVYFESEDGINWQRPNLDLFPKHETVDRNVIVHGGLDNLFVLPLPKRMHHRGKYAMLYCNNIDLNFLVDSENMHGMRNYLAFSDDGINWTDATENPVWYGRTDTNNCIIYNPDRDVFMMYRRATINAGEIRRIAYSESTDLVSWKQPTTIIRRDELDPLFLYGMPVSSYNGIYLGLLHCLYGNINSEKHLSHGKDFKMDTQLAWSRDGVNWERHPQRPIFIPTSPPTKGVHDWGMVRGMANIIEVGDTVHIYYGGNPRLHPPGYATTNLSQGICLATVKRDRFVAISAGINGGYMLTKPLSCPPGKLHINGRTNHDGFIQVAIREGDGVRDGEWPKNWRFDTSIPFKGDSLDHSMLWEGDMGLTSFSGKTIRLHFWLENAELYSFWIA